MEWWTTSLIHYEDFIISPKPERCWTWMGHHSWIWKLRLEVETWKVKLLLLLLLLFFLPMFSYNHSFFSYKSACFLGFNLNSYQASLSLSYWLFRKWSEKKKIWTRNWFLFLFILYELKPNQTELSNNVLVDFFFLRQKRVLGFR